MGTPRPEIPDHQIATLAVTMQVLMDELGVNEDEALRVAVLVDGAIKDALEEFGPELTLRAAEVLWAEDAD
jgi:hypothetical protein